MVMILFEKGIFVTAFFFFNVLTVFLVLVGREEKKKKNGERDDPCLKNLKSEERKNRTELTGGLRGQRSLGREERKHNGSVSVELELERPRYFMSIFRIRNSRTPQAWKVTEHRVYCLG